jgi:hypothetical protein
MTQGAVVQAAADTPAGYWLFVLGKLDEKDKETVLHYSPGGRLAVYTSESTARAAKGKAIPTIPLQPKFYPWLEICRQFGGKSAIVDWYPGAEGNFTVFNIPRA